MAQKQRVGIRGRSSSSKTLGIADPRLSRNVRVHTRGEDDAPPLIRDDFGRRSISTDGSLQVVNGKLTVNSGSLGLGILATKTVTAAYTLTLSDDVVLADTTSGAFSLSLPKASLAEGKVYHLKKVSADASDMTIDAFSSETIDGATTQATPFQYVSFMIVCDGTEWHIL